MATEPVGVRSCCLKEEIHGMGEFSAVKLLVLLEAHNVNLCLIHLNRKLLNFRKDNYSQTIDESFRDLFKN